MRLRKFWAGNVTHTVCVLMFGRFTDKQSVCINVHQVLGTIWAFRDWFNLCEMNELVQLGD